MLRLKILVESFQISYPNKNPYNNEHAFSMFKEMVKIEEDAEYFVIFADNHWHLYKLRPIQ